MPSTTFTHSIVSVLAWLLLSPCIAEAADTPEPLPPPGTVLSERWEDLHFGFREVARSQVNPVGAFEGIGHFVFVYFREEQLCQCSRNEIAISPDGMLLIYTDVIGGNLMLFRTKSRERVALTKEFVGYPTSAAWNLPAKQVVVTLANGNRKFISVSL